MELNKKSSSRFLSSSIFRDKLVRVLLWVGLAALTTFSALSIFGFNLKGSNMAVANPAVSEKILLTDSSGSSGFAEMYVSSWLLGDDISRFYPDAVSRTGSKHLIGKVVTVSTKVLDADYVQVVVAAEVGDELTGNNTLTVVFFSVGVETSNGRVVATGLPSQHSAPLSFRSVETFAGDFKSLGSSEVLPFVEPVQGFLEAYLVGAGSVQPFLAPKVSIESLGPVFDEVGLEGVAIKEFNDLIILRALVRGSKGESVQVQHFHLKMKSRDGRWEVTEILGAAPLSGGKE